jgi:hypothetical protein
MADKADSVAKHYEATDLETRSRQLGGFAGVEADLPDIRSSEGSDGRPSTATGLLSYLGHWNPVPQDITGKDQVWLLDNTAYKSAETDFWQAEFIAAVFDRNTGVELSKVVAKVAEKVGVGKGDAAVATIQVRLMPLVQSILPGRRVTVDFGQSKEIELGPGGRNAISNDTKVLPRHAGGHIVTSVAQVPEGANGELQMRTVYAEPTGWGIISGTSGTSGADLTLPDSLIDIDDSIKITQTSNPIGILRSTFVSTPTPVSGMPELYAYIRKTITPSAPFFYLSASPYNLYPFLRKFLGEFYPHGTIILRDASWMNLSGLLSTLTLGTQAYKVSRMKKMNTWLPQRKMICIGDSTQSDPEAYGEIYRTYPGWIRLIFIRKVTDIAEGNLKEKNEPSRFEKAFESVPPDVWHVFESPEECYKIIGDVVEKES